MKFFNYIHPFCGALYILFALIIGITTLGQVLWVDGWLQNHENTSFFIRTIVYADHILSGDYFPIWSSTDNNGLGSPQPLFYHKLFYLVAGALYALTGALKYSVIIAILIFLWVGAFGMYVLCIELGCRKKIAFSGALMIMVANYTITNWLIRGAMAEFSACMLIPVVLALYLRIINKKNYIDACSFGAIVALLFLAHSVMAFYIILFLIIITLFVISRERSVRVIFLLICSIGIFFLILSPYLYMMFVFSKDYNISRITPDIYRPENRFMPLSNYFWDSTWTWGTIWSGYTVQLDTSVIVLLIVLGGVALYKKINWKRVIFSNSGMTICGIILLCLLLQCEISAFFYKNFPGAVYLQFPWRLLGILTPCLIVAALLSCQYLLPKFSHLLCGVTMSIMFMTSGAYAPIKYDGIVIPLNLDNIVFSAFHEYEPQLSSNITKETIINFLEKNGVQLSVLEPQSLEHDSLFICYKIAAMKEGAYPLPLFSSEKHKITIFEKSKIINFPCEKIESFPGFCGVSLREGEAEVLVEFPRFR